MCYWKTWRCRLFFLSLSTFLLSLFLSLFVIVIIIILYPVVVYLERKMRWLLWFTVIYILSSCPYREQHEDDCLWLTESIHSLTMIWIKTICWEIFNCALREQFFNMYSLPYLRIAAFFKDSCVFIFIFRIYIVLMVCGCAHVCGVISLNW